MILFIWNIQRGKSTDTKADWWLPGARGIDMVGWEGALWGDENVLTSSL